MPTIFEAANDPEDWWRERLQEIMSSATLDYAA
jgi:hypothetical protein